MEMGVGLDNLGDDLVSDLAMAENTEAILILLGEEIFGKLLVGGECVPEEEVDDGVDEGGDELVLELRMSLMDSIEEELGGDLGGGDTEGESSFHLYGTTPLGVTTMREVSWT